VSFATLRYLASSAYLPNGLYKGLCFACSFFKIGVQLISQCQFNSIINIRINSKSLAYIVQNFVNFGPVTFLFFNPTFFTPAVVSKKIPPLFTSMPCGLKRVFVDGMQLSDGVRERERETARVAITTHGSWSAWRAASATRRYRRVVASVGRVVRCRRRRRRWVPRRHLGRRRLGLSPSRRPHRADSGPASAAREISRWYWRHPSPTPASDIVSYTRPDFIATPQSVTS